MRENFIVFAGGAFESTFRTPPSLKRVPLIVAMPHPPQAQNSKGAGLVAVSPSHDVVN